MIDDAKESFGMTVTDVTAGRQVPREQNCYGYAFINKGDEGVRVNEIFLKPYPPGQPELSGESFTFVDPLRRVYNRDFTVVFDGGGTAPLVQIVQVYKAKAY